MFYIKEQKRLKMRAADLLDKGAKNSSSFLEVHTNAFVISFEFHEGLIKCSSSYILH